MLQFSRLQMAGLRPEAGLGFGSASSIFCVFSCLSSTSKQGSSVVGTAVHRLLNAFK